VPADLDCSVMDGTGDAGEVGGSGDVAWTADADALEGRHRVVQRAGAYDLVEDVAAANGEVHL